MKFDKILLVMKMSIRENFDIYFELVEDVRSQAHITTICSTAKMKEYEKPMHIITALLVDNAVSLGQKTVENKSNEIPAVRELLDELDIQGAVVTMDAMYCQKETAEKRTYYVLNEVAYFTDYIAEWKELKKIFAIKR